MRRCLSWIAYVCVGICCAWSPGQAGAAQGESLVGIELGDSIVLRPSAQYRARFLANGGNDFKAGNNFDAFSHRARLGLEAQMLTWFRLKVQLQDVRTWGEETNTLGDFRADGFDVHQAWAEASCPLGLTLRIGRQELAYDNHRLIGTVGWKDQARSFDAIRAAYSGKEGAVQAHLFYAKTGEQDAYEATTDAKGDLVTLSGSRQDTDLAGLWARYQGLSFLRPSLSAFYDWVGPTNQNRVTVGLFVDGEPVQGLSYTGEFYYQAGRTGNESQRKDIAAFMGALALAYRAPLWSHPSVKLWFEYLSGDDDPGDDTVGTFDTLFATNHKFYGFMDYFINLPVNTGGLGLVDIGGRLQFQPAPWLNALIDYHHFELAKEHSSGARTVGNEVDLALTFPVNKHLTLQGVFAVFVPKLGGAHLRNDGSHKRTELYGYVQTDLRF